jgi:hypothetical protein
MWRCELDGVAHNYSLLYLPLSAMCECMHLNYVFAVDDAQASDFEELNSAKDN